MNSNGEPHSEIEQISSQPKRTIYLLLFFALGVLIFLLLLLQSGRSITTVTLLWVLAAGVLLILEHRFGDQLSGSKILPVAAIIILSLGLSYYLFGMNLKAQFWILDDHQIVTYLGEDGKMALSELPELLMQTEVGRAGEYPRFRPSYFTMRLLETWLWGKNPTLWYLSRILMAALFMSVFWIVLSKLIGILPAGLTTLFVFTLPMWGDIFSRLGPGETYAVAALALFILGAYFLLRPAPAGLDKWQPTLGWILLTAGALLAVGSKENFLILLPVMLILLLVAIKRGQARGAALTANLLVLLFAGVITWAILTALSKRGADIYGRSTGLNDRALRLWDGVRTEESIIMLAALILIGALVIWSYRYAQRMGIRRAAVIAFGSILAIYLLYISQYTFYSNIWPSGNRYDLPGIFYKPLFLIILAWFGLEALGSSKVDPIGPAALRAGLIVGTAMLIGATSFSAVRASGHRNVENTGHFAGQLARVTDTLQNDPDAALVIESHFVMDYETIFSWGEFLHANGVKNPIFLRMAGYTPNTVEPGFHETLANILTEASREGLRGLSPIAALDVHQNNCYSLQLSGKTESNCRNLE